MKNAFILVVILGFIGFFPPNALAQTSDIETQSVLQENTLATTLEAPKDRNLTFFLTGYPIPIVQSKGVGFGLDYSFLPSAFLSVAFNQISQGQFNGMFAQEWGDRNQFYSISVKLVPLKLSFTSIYLGAGYQKGEMSSFITPGLLQGLRADSHTKYEGAFASLGFRLEGLENDFFTWVLDASLSYAPGTVANSELVVDAPPTFAEPHGKNHLETKLAYGWQPLLYVGGMF